VSEILGEVDQEGDVHGEFSWGPDKRARPPRDSVVLSLLSVATGVLLVAGVVGLIVVRHKSTTPAKVPLASSTTTTTPAPGATSTVPSGPQRLVDGTDRITLTTPAGWQALTVTASTVTPQLQALQARDPQMAPLVNAALSSLQKAQVVGVFAVDPSAPAEVFTYGVAAASSVKSVKALSTTQFVDSLRAAGATDVRATSVDLPVGDGEQVSLQLTGTAAISEYLDYFLYRGRFVFLVVAVPGRAFPTALLHQITESLAPA